MMGLQMIIIANSVIAYDVMAIVKGDPQKEVYIEIGGEKVGAIDTTQEGLIISDIVKELLRGDNLKVAVAEAVPETSEVYIVVKDSLSEFRMPMPRFIEPPLVVPSGVPIKVKVKIEGVNLSDFEDPRVYLMRGDSLSGAFVLVEEEPGVLGGEIKDNFAPGSYTMAFVINSKKYDLEVRVYRNLTILFPFSYRFSSAASGFVNQYIHYCLEIDGSDNITDVVASAEIEHEESGQIFIMPLLGTGKYMCGKLIAPEPGTYVARFMGVASGFFEGTPVDIPIKGETKDRVLFKFDSAWVEKDRKVQVNKYYKAKVYISAFGEEYPLRVLGVLVSKPDSIIIEVDRGKEIMVGDSSAIDLDFALKEGADPNGVYPFRIYFRDATGGQKYFLDLELHMGESGWKIIEMQELKEKEKQKGGQ